MKAIILAAGRGSRMGEDTVNIPKCMMTLDGRSLLDRCIESLRAANFDYNDIGIVSGYRHEILQEKIQTLGLKHFHNCNWETTNMVSSLLTADEWLCKEPCIVCYSDIIFHPNAVKVLTGSDSEIAITSYTGFWKLWQKRFSDPLEDLETFKSSNGWLIEIGKKPKCKDDIQGQYMGILFFKPSGWKKVKQTIKLPMIKAVEKLDMTTLLHHLVEQGHRIKTLECCELWYEFDSISDIRAYS